jgi:hypothetical protein
MRSPRGKQAASDGAGEIVTFRDNEKKWWIHALRKMVKEDCERKMRNPAFRVML